MSKLYVIVECVKSWPWSELFFTLIGALFAFALPIIYEIIRNKREQKNALINYYYNLHIVFRNIFQYVMSIDHNIKQARDTGEKFVEIPAPDFSFDESVQKLAFVVSKNPLFYEAIIQLNLDFGGFKNLTVSIQKDLQLDAFITFAFPAMLPMTKIEIMIQNTAKYIKKYYSVNLSDDRILKTMKEFERWKETSLKNIETNQKGDKFVQNLVLEMRKELDSVKEDFTLNF